MKAHLNETALRRFVRDEHENPGAVLAHLEGCRECFSKYMVVLELEHDSHGRVDSAIVDQIVRSRVQRATVRRWLAAAGVLTALAIGITGYIRWSTGEAALDLVGRIGECRQDGGALERGGGFASGTVRSQPFSICDFEARNKYSIRLLERTVLQRTADLRYRVVDGRVAVDRRRDVALVVEVGEVMVSFEGTKVVVDQRSAVVSVLEGAVRITRSSSGRSWRVAAGQASGLNADVRPLRADEKRTLEDLFRPLPKNPSEFPEVMRALHPDKQLVFQEVRTKNGETVRGLVTTDGAYHIIVAESGSRRIPSSDVEAVRFVPR